MGVVRSYFISYNEQTTHLSYEAYVYPVLHHNMSCLRAWNQAEPNVAVSHSAEMETKRS